MFDNIHRIVRNNEMMNPAFRNVGGMIDSVNIVSVDSQAIMNGWENSMNCDTTHMILPLLVMRTESSLVRWVWVQCLPMVLLEVGSGVL